jgi:hypothetical protein
MTYILRNLNPQPLSCESSASNTKVSFFRKTFKSLNLLKQLSKQNISCEFLKFKKKFGKTF